MVATARHRSDGGDENGRHKGSGYHALQTNQ
jgi:hypothetical protein